MPITFLDEKPKRKVTFLDEKRKVTFLDEPPQRKVTFLDEPLDVSRLPDKIKQRSYGVTGDFDTGRITFDRPIRAALQTGFGEAKDTIGDIFEAGRRYPRAVFRGLEAAQKGEDIVGGIKKGFVPEIYAPKEKVRTPTQISWDIADRFYKKPSTNVAWEAVKLAPFTAAGVLGELTLDPALKLAFSGINKVITSPAVAKYLGKNIPAPKWFDNLIKNSIKGFHRPLETVAENVRSNRIETLTNEVYSKITPEVREALGKGLRQKLTDNDLKGLIKAEFVKGGIYETPLRKIQADIRAVRQATPKIAGTKPVRRDTAPETPIAPKLLQAPQKPVTPQITPVLAPLPSAVTPKPVIDVTKLQDKSVISKPIKPLAQEALKYKSAVEFVEKKLKAFHGTDVRFNKFDTQQEGRFGSHFGTKETISNIAKSTGKDASKFKVIPVALNIKNPIRLPDLKFWETKDIVRELKKKGIEIPQKSYLGEGFSTYKDIINTLKKEGYDGVVYRNKIEGGGDSFIVFDSNQIKTKSQLTEIWNQAQQPKLDVSKLPDKAAVLQPEAERFKQGRVKQLIEEVKSIDNQLNILEKQRSLLRKKGISIKGVDRKIDILTGKFSSLYSDVVKRDIGKFNIESLKKREGKILAEALRKGERKGFQIGKKEGKAEVESAKDILDRRRFSIRAVRDQFKLTDTELKQITQRDIRLMSNFEFKQYIDDIRIKAEKIDASRQLTSELRDVLQRGGKIGKEKPLTKIEGFDNFDSEPLLRSEIEKVSDLKLSGEISLLQANEILKEIKTSKVKLAKQKGIAVSKTPEGKDRVAIRKSGFYAKAEIENAPIRDVYSQFQPPSNMALMQDGYQRGKPFGVIFKEVWIPTQKAFANSIDAKKKFDNKIISIAKKYKAPFSNNAFGIKVSDMVEGKIETPEKYKGMIKELRQDFDKKRELVNNVRGVMHRSLMGYIQDYLPHMQKTSKWNELIDNEATITDNFDFIIPNQTRNPFAFKRLMEEIQKPERNFFVLAERYNSAMAKDLYITPAIENIKAYNGVLKDKGLFKASMFWDEFIRTGLLGKMQKIDSALSVSPIVRKGLKKWKDILSKAFLTGKLSWNIATQPLSYISLTPVEAGYRNTAVAVFKMFNKGIRRSVREHSVSLRIKSSDILSSAVGEGRGLANRIYRTPLNKWNDMVSVISAVEEQILHEASYIAGLDKAKQLGYIGEDAHMFADITAERSQGMYSKESRALILNSDIVTAAIPFQSFSVGLSNHAKEVLTKSSGAVKLNKRQRFGKLIRLLVGIWLANQYSQAITGRKKTTLGTFIPFAGETVDRLKAKTFKKGYTPSRSPVSQIDIYLELVKASKDFIKYGDTKRLRKIGITFGPALFGAGGGGQISNLVDGIIADIEGEVTNVRGKKLFDVKDLESQIKAPIFGVWSTPGSREYWRKRTEGKAEKKFNPQQLREALRAKLKRDIAKKR